MKTGFRRTWRNHTGNQRCQPAEVRRPATLGEVVEAVRDAEGAGLTVRAVGSGHSWSDAALTTGILLLPEGLAGPLPLEPELLRKEVDAAIRDEGDLLLNSSHPQGGNPMSDDERVGVVGTDFRVHGTRNLFVADASVFPTSIHVNPQLTIMAMAGLAWERGVAEAA